MYFKMIVFKQTNENWYPSYKMGDLYMVKVTFNTIVPDTGEYRVSVWGNDDFGMELDVKSYSLAKKYFDLIIEQDYVTQDFLDQRGFVPA